MSDTARDYQTTEAASIEGLDGLFEDVATSADSLPFESDDFATTADSGTWLAVTEVASIKKKSERTIQRYAKQGKLTSKVDESGKLLIWMPTAADIVLSSPEGVATVADTDQVLKTGVATDADKNGAGDKNVATISETDRLWQLLKEKDAKIEALVMRNGYLQSQADTAQETIKLLTDSRHNSGWWARFSSWFFQSR